MGLVSLLVERGLSNHGQNNKLYSDNKILIIRSLVTACSCLSIAAGLLAFYWFLRMNRKFRHSYGQIRSFHHVPSADTLDSLIMTLIVSDLCKDLNYMIFAVISFVQGSPQSGSAYCSASGFMIALFTEISGV